MPPNTRQQPCSSFPRCVSSVVPRGRGVSSPRTSRYGCATCLDARSTPSVGARETPVGVSARQGSRRDFFNRFLTCNETTNLGPRTLFHPRTAHLGGILRLRGRQTVDSTWAAPKKRFTGQSIKSMPWIFCPCSTKILSMTMVSTQLPFLIHRHRAGCPVIRVEKTGHNTTVKVSVDIEATNIHVFINWVKLVVVGASLSQAEVVRTWGKTHGGWIQCLVVSISRKSGFSHNCRRRRHP